MIKTTLKVKGMACGMCEAHINDEIRKNFNVKKVSSSHTKGETVIISEEPVDEDRQIRTFLQKKGYDRETWTRQEKGKLAAALARKGFSWEAVYRMLGGDGEDGDF